MIDRVCSLIKMQKPLRNRGLLFSSGATVPVDGTDNYQTGCIFQHTDGTDDTSLYVNEGSVTSCDFNPVSIAAAGEMAQIEFDDGLTGPLISISTDDPTDDSYTTPFLITGTYSSTCALALQLSATNARPVSFLFDDGGEALGAGDYRATLSRVLLCETQTNAVTLNALRGQVKMLDLVMIDSANSVVAPITGYLELAGTSGRVLNGNVACVRAALEEGASGATTVGSYMSGFEATLHSTRTYDGDGWLAAYTVNVHGGTSKWQYGLHMRGDSISSGILIGAQGEGASLTTAFPFAVEVHSQADADIVAGDTGSSAGIYARNSIEFDQTSSTAHIGIFGKLRVKQDLADGNHAGLMGWVEISGTTEIGGAATTTTSAGSFAVIAESGLDLSTGHLNGLLVNCSVDDAAIITGTMTGIRLNANSGCYGWTTGVLVDLGTNVAATLELGSTGVSIILPQSTNDAASPALLGLSIAASGAMTAVTSGDPTFTGISITTPACVCTADTIVSTGLSITTGAITQTGGTMTSRGILITGGTITSGNSIGIDLAGIFTTGIQVAQCTNLLDLPASGTAPVAVGGTVGTHGTATLKIAIDIGGSTYYLLASTVPTFT